MEKRFTLLIGGKAGQGIATLSRFMSEVLAKNGLFSFSYRDYRSLIRGGHNFNIITFSNTPISSFEEKFDVIVALDRETLLHEKNLKEGGIIINEHDNIKTLAILCNLFNLDSRHCIKLIKEKFPSEVNIFERALKENKIRRKNKLSIERSPKKIKVLSGSEGIVEGALLSGMDFYFAYPMTPATPVLHILTNRRKDIGKKLEVFQPENEIAVVNIALGTNFAGAKTMIGTSGGGFALMNEAISLAGQAELPLVLYLASRKGPSTGVPTYTSQEDLLYALYSGHGFFSKVVIAPYNGLDCIKATAEAFHLAFKFNIPVILLSDKEIAESVYTFEEKEVERVRRYAKNLIIENSFSKKIGKQIIKVSSYEHDKKGFTLEEAEGVEEGSKKRLKKEKELNSYIKKFTTVLFNDKPFKKKVINSDKLIISWGSTYGAIKKFLENNNFDWLHFRILKPLPDLKINSKKIIFVEHSSKCQLYELIRYQLAPSKLKFVLRFDARPITPTFLEKKLKQYKHR